MFVRTSPKARWSHGKKGLDVGDRSEIREVAAKLRYSMGQNRVPRGKKVPSPLSRVFAVDGVLQIEAPSEEHDAASEAVSRAVAEFTAAQLKGGSFDPGNLRAAFTAIARDGIEVGKFGDALSKFGDALSKRKVRRSTLDSSPGTEWPIGAYGDMEAKHGLEHHSQTTVGSDAPTVGSRDSSASAATLEGLRVDMAECRQRAERTAARIPTMSL
jgi:hypothetical protein